MVLWCCFPSFEEHEMAPSYKEESEDALEIVGGYQKMFSFFVQCQMSSARFLLALITTNNH